MFTMIIVLLGPCPCHCPANKFLAAACLLSSGLNPFAPPCSLCCFGQWLLVEWVALVHGSCYCIVSSTVPSCRRFNRLVWLGANYLCLDLQLLEKQLSSKCDSHLPSAFHCGRD